MADEIEAGRLTVNVTRDGRRRVQADIQFNGDAAADPTERLIAAVRAGMAKFKQEGKIVGGVDVRAATSDAGAVSVTLTADIAAPGLDDLPGTHC